MSERKEVMSWLEGLTFEDWRDYHSDSEVQTIAKEAFALLKEQEAVEPILEQDSMVCGVCGHEVVWQKMLGDGIWADEALNYCPHCGRPVKWE